MAYIYCIAAGEHPWAGGGGGGVVMAAAPPAGWSTRGAGAGYTYLLFVSFDLINARRGC